MKFIHGKSLTVKMELLHFLLAPPLLGLQLVPDSDYTGGSSKQQVLVVNKVGQSTYVVFVEGIFDSVYPGGSSKRDGDSTMSRTPGAPFKESDRTRNRVGTP